MSTWNIVYEEGPLEGICAVCLGIQKGWTMHICADRLDKLDKDGKDELITIPLLINSKLPFNHAVTVAGGFEVCISHCQPVKYVKQRSAAWGKPGPNLIVPS